jgi:multidrug efflux system membrane fusion protein
MSHYCVSALQAAGTGSVKRAVVALMCGILLIAAGCSTEKPEAPQKKAGGKGAGGPVPVIVATAESRTVPVRIHAIGAVEPYASVSVKSRVDGQINQVGFADGQEVAAGHMLFQLDPRPAQAQLQQAEATLLREKATLERARAQEQRYRNLLQKNFISKDAYAQYLTNVETASAAAKAAEATVESAKLQVEYTTIRSPIAGRTGRVLIQTGNQVKANDTVALVVINQISPVWVSFAVPEQHLAAIRKYSTGGRLQVEARSTGSEDAIATGQLSFIDNTVDAATGTVRLRAVFQNRDRVLWPGQFVTAAMTLREQKDAIIIPAQALQTGANGQHVFVVKSDSTAELRPVTVERSEGSIAVIAKGVAAGDRVVTTGQSRLTRGSKVDVRPAQGDGK